MEGTCVQLLLLLLLTYAPHRLSQTPGSLITGTAPRQDRSKADPTVTFSPVLPPSPSPKRPARAAVRPVTGALLLRSQSSPISLISASLPGPQATDSGQSEMSAGGQGPPATSWPPLHVTEKHGPDTFPLLAGCCFFLSPTRSAKGAIE